MFIFIFLFLLFPINLYSKGIYIVEERNGKTYTQPFTSQTPEQIGEKIKELFDLKMDNSNKVGYNPIISSYMKSLYKKMEKYQQQEGNHDEEEEVKTWLTADKIISSMARQVSHRLSDNSYNILFSRDVIPILTAEQSIVKAQLRVHVKGLVSPTFFVLDDTNLADDTILVSNNDPIIVSDILPILTRWSESHTSALPMISIHASTESNLEFEAFIVVALKDTRNEDIPKRRARREVPTTPLTSSPMKQKMRRSESAYFEKTGANALCQRKGMYVDFDALGWKQWVIAPEGFSAFYCSGACSAPFHQTMNATSHAIVQSLIHLVRPNATAASKCAPSHLGTLSILFVDNKKDVQIKRYRDMIVEECGCH